MSESKSKLLLLLLSNAPPCHDMTLPEHETLVAQLRQILGKPGPSKLTPDLEPMVKTMLSIPRTPKLAMDNKWWLVTWNKSKTFRETCNELELSSKLPETVMSACNLVFRVDFVSNVISACSRKDKDSVTAAADWARDHRMPEKYGGECSERNLFALQARANLIKGSKLMSFRHSAQLRIGYDVPRFLSGLLSKRKWYGRDVLPAMLGFDPLKEDNLVSFLTKRTMFRVIFPTEREQADAAQALITIATFTQKQGKESKSARPSDSQPPTAAVEPRHEDGKEEVQTPGAVAPRALPEPVRLAVHAWCDQAGASRASVRKRVERILRDADDVGKATREFLWSMSDTTNSDEVVRLVKKTSTLELALGQLKL